MINFKTFTLILLIILFASKGCEYLVSENEKKQKQIEIEENSDKLKFELETEKKNIKMIMKDYSVFTEEELIFFTKFSNSIGNLSAAFMKNEYPLKIYDLKDNITFEYSTRITGTSKMEWTFYNFTKNNYVIVDSTQNLPYIKGRLFSIKSEEPLVKINHSVEFKDKWEFAKFILDGYKKYYKTREKIVPNLYTHKNNDISKFGNDISKKIICSKNSTTYCSAFQTRIYRTEYQSFRLPAVMSNLIVQDIEKEKNKGKSKVRIFIDNSTEYLAKAVLFVNPVTRRLIRNEIIEAIEEHEGRRNFKLFGHPEEVNEMNILLLIYPNF